MTKMYPVLKGNMAFGGTVNPEITKHLLLEFNCLGIQGTQDVTLVITSAMNQHIEFTFRKQCPNSKSGLLITYNRVHLLSGERRPEVLSLL
jgi:hypothetical protein